MLIIFKDGLHRPIHFFPESSWKYCESFIKDKDPEKAIQKAKKEWEGSDYKVGEGEDDYYRFCFREVDPIDEEFVRLSKEIFLPIIFHTKKEE